MWKNVGFLAKHNGVSRIAIGNWIRSGKYKKVKRTEGGHYRVWVEDPKHVIGYARVSSQKQITSIESQSAIIRKHYPGIEIVHDVGSSCNFKRRNFRAILERCLSGTPICIVVTTNDRLAKGGFAFIKWAIELHGGEVIELEKSEPEDRFDPGELIRLITSFVASYHGKRSRSRKKGKSLP